MYSEQDIDGAVAAGALTRDAAEALRRHVAAMHAQPTVDEESFRLLTGFNDIFVTIAIVLLLVALAEIGGRLSVALAGALVAGSSWLLASYFTARRRMALPSIVLLIAFVGGVAATLVGALFDANIHDLPQRSQGLVAAGIGLVAAGAAWLHWRRFAVPITVAAGAVAGVGVVIGLALAIAPGLSTALWPVLLVAGLAVFALAMWWDLSDPERRTRRADVAFWLHLAAAPMIAHPLFQLLGVFRPDAGAATAVVVLLLYGAFAVVALAVDRRALLVSGLVYVLAALYQLVRTAGAVELGQAIAALVIGSALLLLSAFWQPVRARVVALLGDGARRLPPSSPRPA